MATLFGRHKVLEFGAWKRGYDELIPVRKAMGVKRASVHRDTSDPDIVMVTHQFDSVSAMMAFFNSEELKAAMPKAGVVGQPEFWFSEDVEQTPY